MKRFTRFCAWVTLFTVTLTAFALPDALNAWTDEYNSLAPLTGAPVVSANGFEEADDGSYVYGLSESAMFGLYLDSGAVVAIALTTTDALSEHVSLLCALLAASDSSVSIDDARRFFTELSAQENSFTSADYGEWMYLYYAADNEGSHLVMFKNGSYLKDIGIGGLFEPDDEPASPNSGFWDGLWGDDEPVSPIPSVPASPAVKDKTIYKI